GLAARTADPLRDGRTRRAGPDLRRPALPARAGAEAAAPPRDRELPLRDPALRAGAVRRREARVRRRLGRDRDVRAHAPARARHALRRALPGREGRDLALRAELQLRLADGLPLEEGRAGVPEGDEGRVPGALRQLEVQPVEPGSVEGRALRAGDLRRDDVRVP